MVQTIIFRTALPFLKSGAKSVGKEVLKTSTQIANDMLEGQSFPESARQRTNETGKKLIKKAIQKADEMIGRGKKHQRYKRKRKGMKATSSSKSKKLSPTQTVIEKVNGYNSIPLLMLQMEVLLNSSYLEVVMLYLDLSQTQLHVRAKIFKSDGKVITNENKVGPVNIFLHSLFSQVDVCLNERTVSSSNNTYPYRAIIETLLNHGYDSKTSQLTSELYYKDTAGRMNVYDENDKEPNEGFKSRVKFIKGSGTVDMVGRLHVDLFNQDRLLLNLVDVKLKLIRSKPSFCLMEREITT
ncbi:uncharacterized protein F54H12.2 [Trichonephila clavipes]|nr:uncharacterized protein F54H12.2 [Trichonephila clavipes]